MREIIFYRTAGGRSPVEEFLDSLSPKQARKVVWVLQLVEEIDLVPVRYFKKLVGTDEIWEVRVDVSGDTFRILGFQDGKSFVVLKSRLPKESPKDTGKGNPGCVETKTRVPREERIIMSDLKTYISRRRAKDPEFDEGFDDGYRAFRRGVLARQARGASGLTQIEMVERPRARIEPDTLGAIPNRVKGEV
uniref:Phage derived protein Gp49-like (DUF891) n=1 Tax=Candidatus Kentrum eta TaxID=2126337 RepID=A0A450VFE2_9GAMM|nr:MAG: Phage derived protein Gp49-like (DUF891) [Candidatus Kentron sp. H]VFK04068.1 MAG: Phage derived protein Gp49-like (DUF891) [Candidatus Kentron sp. H]VFK06497.1 MAG: Phage derived protein Gp49-like (DUF891) [Candidatus Kentron sp. H]